METGRDFEKGDRVRQKCHKLVMVVEDVYQPFFSYRYRCKWTDAEGVVQVELFRVDDLEHAD